MDLAATHMIVLGNEKGGSGKSTTAMHLVAALLKSGAAVGALDLDSRQRTFSRYVANRQAFVRRKGVKLAMPAVEVVDRAVADTFADAEADETARLEAALERMAGCDFVVTDCPGSDTHLSRLAHARADTLITPLNDSFVDFDVFADVDPEHHRIRRSSQYAEMVWEARKQRAQAGHGSIDWVVMRNRLSQLDARNKRRIEQVMDSLARRIGFRVAPGFAERVIYREMYLNGLTLLDLRDEGAGVSLSMSHVAARAEVRSLLATLRLPGIGEDVLARL